MTGKIRSEVFRDMPRTWSCPFWSWEDGHRVYCEGCRLDFKAKDARDDYVSRYCANVPGWENCTIAQELLRLEERHEE